MSVHNIGGNNPVQRIINNPIQKTVPTGSGTPAQATRPSDKLELSGLSNFLKLAKTGDVRADKVAQVKSAIENGTYETDDKLDAAADRLLDDLAK